MSNLVGCDYTCQRKKNIFRLKDLYEKELNNYYNSYNQYLQYKYDTSRDANWKRNYAETRLKPKVKGINANLNRMLKEYNLSIDVMDPLANKEEVKKNYNIDIFNSIPADNSYQIIILAVPHKKFISLKGEILYRNLDKEGLIIDLKSSLPEMEKVIRI